MRPLLVLLVACSHATPPPAVIGHGATPAATAADLRARVAVAGGGSWIDVRVDGTDAAARAFCQRLVERELRAPHGVVDMTVARECAAEALPAATAAGAYRLVERERVSSDDASLDDMLAGHRDELAHATGQLVRMFPAADRVACEQQKAGLDAGDYQAWFQDQQAEQATIDSEVAEARGREKRACDDVHRLQPCTKGDTPCDVLHADVTRTCNQATATRQTLEQRSATPEQAPASRYTCEPR
jgi:hypothetical protein